jgi:hypothetical protein
MKSSSLDHQETSGSEPVTPTFKAWLCRKIDPDEYHLADQVIADAHGLDSNQYLAFRACRTFARFVRHKQTGELRVASSHCKNKWCPICAKSKAHRIGSKLIEWMDTVDRPKLLTLTLKHSNAPLRNQFEALTGFFKRLRKERFWKTHVRGGVWAFQLTYNHDTDEWHPHIHAIIDADHVDQQIYSSHWLHVTHTSKIVDIRKVTNNEKGASYVSRYVSRPIKLTDLPPYRHAELYEECKGRRMVNAFGNAHGAGVLTKEKVDRDDWEYVADWSEIFKSRKTDPRSMLIWNAWTENVPVKSEEIRPPRSRPDLAPNMARPPPELSQQTFPFGVEAKEEWMLCH